MAEPTLLEDARSLSGTLEPEPFKTQLLKWIGNKQRMGHLIGAFFPADYGTYFEPFLGSAGVLGVLAPEKAFASDLFGPLIEIWQTLQTDQPLLCKWYSDRWEQYFHAEDRVLAYELIKANYNSNPNPADLLFLSRSCYGGVVRFRKDGHMSTPSGPHRPISPESFTSRATEWAARTSGVTFMNMDFREAMDRAVSGDVIYCDPPYTDTQSILYGAQAFSLPDLMEHIHLAKRRGVKVALSIDGTKKSGAKKISLPIPEGLFEREAIINVGRSMLRRFQMDGLSLEGEVVTDRLLLTW